VLEVEEVSGKAALRRFVELPYALHHGQPEWAPLLLRYERWRLDPHRNPFFDRGDAAYFLLRRGGKPVGRVTAHVASDAPGVDGCFGFFAVEDDAAAASLLVDAARTWLAGKGCTTMTGPLSFTADDEAGVLVEGFSAPGVTGRPWHPPWYGQHLEAAGLARAADLPTWRLSTDAGGGGAPGRLGGSGDPMPPHAGPYGDRALVLDGIAAVPDVAGALRRAGVRSAWSLAKRAKERNWEGCVVVRVAGDRAALVPGLVAAAGAAGYRWVVAPWSPDARPPEAVHRLFTGPV
jgi:hypothetical protein